MSSSDSPTAYQSNSPLASTEEKSIQDNININKFNLEKGLKNRPNQYVLVDRGILLNPGKAYSDKMHQLDIAKKRDRLKKKIENRPDRDELVRKLILQDGEECRKNERNMIKQMLDSSINYRPGTLELVDKNILKVDHFLASKIHHGDISYPKVCRDDLFIEPNNNLTTLPSISEVDIQVARESFDVAPQSPARTTTVKGAQISCKKTCRVGRFSFHNIEFRPAAQKAREIQQNELLEYQKIQAQHDPSLKKVHSELALKSRSISDSRSDKSRSSKGSLLNRLNVHELKSECKARLISCSNVPKAQLVERLLPYEAEVIRTHTSFDQNRMTTPDRRSSSSFQSSNDFSPPDFLSQSNRTPPPYTTTFEQNQLSDSICNGNISSKISHSYSEPTIQNFSGILNCVSPCSINVASGPTVNFYANNPANFNPNGSYPLLNGDPFNPHLSFNSVCSNEFPQGSMKAENVVFQSQPHAAANNFSHFNGFERKIEPMIIQNSNQSISLPEHFYNSPISKIEPMIIKNPNQSIALSGHFYNSSISTDNSSIFVNPMKSSYMNHWYNHIPVEFRIPPIPDDCADKFNVIGKCVDAFKNKVNEINQQKNQNSNSATMSSLFDDFIFSRNHLLNLSLEMIDLIDKEQKFNTISKQNATKQLTWISNLQQLIHNNFTNYSMKYENQLNGADLLSSNGEVPVTNDPCAMQRLTKTPDEFDMIDLLNLESVTHPDQSMHNNVFLETENMDSTWEKRGTYSGSSDLKTPENPLSEICNSPMSTDYFDFLNDWASPLDSYQL